jgi:hypothetical protein
VRDWLLPGETEETLADQMWTCSLSDYRLLFARLEARERGEDVGDEAAAMLSLRGHTVRPSSLSKEEVSEEGR